MGLASGDFHDQIMANAYLGKMGTFWIRGELKRLPDLLLSDENILAVTRGRVDTTIWVMAVTDTRVLLVNKGLLFGYRCLEVPLDRVKSASCRTGLISGSIFIDTGGGTVVLEGINKKCTVEVAAILSQVINAQVKKEAQVKKIGDDVAAQLERLSALRDKGVLSESEFINQKRRLLGKVEVAASPPTLAKPKPKDATAAH